MWRTRRLRMLGRYNWVATPDVNLCNPPSPMVKGTFYPSFKASSSIVEKSSYNCSVRTSSIKIV